MGVGLPYAIGAKFANPDMPVACVTGDGLIQMCIQELSTAKQFGLPIKITNLNNRYLGMVRQQQEIVSAVIAIRDYSRSDSGFRELAESMSLKSQIRVENPTTLCRR